MAYDAREGAGTVYVLDSDGRINPMLRGVTMSNGLAWSPDERTL